jgi:hypothetical protein
MHITMKEIYFDMMCLGNRISKVHVYNQNEILCSYQNYDCKDFLGDDTDVIIFYKKYIK